MEYRIAKGWKIFAWVFFILFVAGGIFLVGKAFTDPSMSRQAGIIAGVTIPFIGLMAFGWLDALRTLIVVDEQAISVTRAFTSRTVSLKDIKGYRIGEKDTFSIELQDDGKKLGIPQYLENRKDLIDWIKEKYQDLDELEKEQETEVLLENDQFGVTREERERRLAIAKKIDGVAMVVGIGSFFWSIFYPEPYEVLMIILFVMPCLGMGITWYFKGLMKLYKAKKSPYPSMVLLMCMSVFAALIAVIRSYNLYSFGEKAWSMLIGITIAVSVVCIAACWQTIATSGKKALTYVCIFVVAGVYSYALLIFSNCHYDTSSPVYYHVAVMGKRKSTGKSTSYYVSLTRWGRYADGDEVSVSKSFYQGVSESDSITVFLNFGKWNIPWYRLRRWNHQ